MSPKICLSMCAESLSKVIALLFLSITLQLAQARAEDTATTHPLSRDVREKLTAELTESLAKLNAAMAKSPGVEDYSRRGDVLFFLGRFDESLADYEKMVELDPETGASHWRRGIVRFYAKRYEAAAKQFEDYHSFDDVDRENGIWRYFSQYRAYGQEKARDGLLKYRKDDREPFPSVYKLFSGDLKPEAIIKQIDDAAIDKAEREKRLFYAHLYIGLNYSLTGQDKAAAQHLREATANQWGPVAGYGPRYMWHTGRIHFDLLTKMKSDSE